jgi:pyruvate dehydrogenase E2 component (dihydrolipoamide acetyltransferase)
LAENQDDIGKFENFVAESTKESPKLEPVASKKEPKVPLQDASTPKSPNESSDRIFVSPIAKQLALEKGIKLELVKGTGPEGRIVKDDILNYKGKAINNFSSCFNSKFTNSCIDDSNWVQRYSAFKCEKSDC